MERHLSRSPPLYPKSHNIPLDIAVSCLQTASRPAFLEFSVIIYRLYIFLLCSLLSYLYLGLMLLNIFLRQPDVDFSLFVH